MRHCSNKLNANTKIINLLPHVFSSKTSCLIHHANVERVLWRHGYCYNRNVTRFLEGSVRHVPGLFKPPLTKPRVQAVASIAVANLSTVSVSSLFAASRIGYVFNTAQTNYVLVPAAGCGYVLRQLLERTASLTRTVHVFLCLITARRPASRRVRFLLSSAYF